MKKHIKPCNCETCEKARYWQPCSGCKDGHPSFWKIVIESPQWKLWETEQERRMKNLSKEGGDKKNKKHQGLYGVYDVAECVECGWISAGHFQEFLKFVKNYL